MSNTDTSPAILITIFNRPDKVTTMIEALRKVKPKKLYFAADGPRNDHPEDASQCEKARSALKAIDWDCKIERKFADRNQGLGLAMESAIDWFFESETEGIILEDDCIPHPDFFTYTKLLLEYYRNSSEVMMITGTNTQQGNWRGDGSYYFSRIGVIWGWATWKNRWKKNSNNKHEINKFLQENKLDTIFKDQKQRDFWTQNLTLKKSVDKLLWDTGWAFTILKTEGMVIVPNTNLVQNIGYGDEMSSTHTKGSGRGWSLPTQSLGKVIHPSTRYICMEADKFHFYTQQHKTVLDKWYNDMNVFLDKVGIKPPIVKLLASLGLR